MILVLRLVWHVFVIAVLLHLRNECLVVNWTALWGLIKVYYFVFTWRLSLRRRCPKWICPRLMTPRWMSPRRKAETDIPEAGGTDGWHRQMTLGGKAWMEGSSVFMAFPPRDILLCHLTWPSQSWRQMALRQIFEKYLEWSIINGGYSTVSAVMLKVLWPYIGVRKKVSS